MTSATPEPRTASVTTPMSTTPVTVEPTSEATSSSAIDEPPPPSPPKAAPKPPHQPPSPGRPLRLQAGLELKENKKNRKWVKKCQTDLENSEAGFSDEKLAMLFAEIEKRMARSHHAPAVAAPAVATPAAAAPAMAAPAVAAPAVAAPATECVVCMNAEKTVVLVPCGHLCICEGCAQKIAGACPICRAEVVSHVRAYL